ncbi:dihydrodipicolinate synthase family protein [Aminobacter carboxidus]|uniref:Dihydrodipicolinate synthase family protein n=1 Tax=Aminobacter carboxidus TaxID=376165 RepID=A0ABR9GWM4_9HYPH|nr:dihydrodipicolinate synthase family protein [Aminobacter carboxidus]
MHKKPDGSFVALITPMNADGSVDLAGFGSLLDFHRQNHTKAILIMGSTGEVSMLTPEERRMIITETAKMPRGDMLLYFGCTGSNTQGTIDLVRYAKNQGGDGAIIAAPSYICADNESIVEYVLEVCDAVDFPIGFYNNPPRVKTDLHWTDIQRISAHPNMVVLKESTTRVGQVAQVCRADLDISVMCCCSPNLGLVIPTMALGGHGTANMTGNIIPREMAIISKPWVSGEDAFACRSAWLRNLPMLHFAYAAVNPVSMKSLMAAVGLPAGPLRKPLRAADPSLLEDGIRIVRELELDRAYGYRLAR